MSVLAMFLFADQNLMAPNLTQIAEEFGFTAAERDTKLGGDISLVFWMLGGLITIPVGFLTDRVNRVRLLTLIILVGEIPCFLTGYAQNYTQLFWLRALTGIGIGGALPLTYSLLADYFPPDRRAAAAGYVGFAMGVGIAVGQLVAGFMGPTYGWRLPFIVVATPNFFLGVLFWLTVREPKRGATDASLPTKIGGWKAIKRLFSVPSNVLIFLQGIAATVPWSVFFVFLNDFYAQDKGFSVEAATLIITAIGGAAILGGFLGGVLGSRLYERSPKYLPVFSGLTTIAGVAPIALLLNYPTQAGVADPSLLMPIVYGGVGGLLLAATAPNVRAMLLNVNPADQRGTTFAFYNLADDLGRGFGPVIISALIVAAGRVWAFNVANLLWLICGLLLLVLTWTFPKDEAPIVGAPDRMPEAAP